MMVVAEVNYSTNLNGLICSGEASTVATVSKEKKAMSINEDSSPY